jgi:hypothetical protein
VRENGRARDRRRWRVCQALVDDAVKKGARVLTGGFLPKGDDPLAAGSFYPPTVLVDVPEVRAPRVLARSSRASRVRRRGARARASGTAAAAGGAEPNERARLVCVFKRSARRTLGRRRACACAARRAAALAIRSPNPSFVRARARALVIRAHSRANATMLRVHSRRAVG